MIGGLNSAINTVFSDFLAFDTRESEWIKGSEVASMTVERAQPACTSFQGRIVVSGGFNLRRDPDYRNKSVEAYDHASNSWSHMPDMIAPRVGHSLVSVKNKLFVVGGETKTFEVFDARSNNFINIKQPPKSFKFDLDKPEFHNAVSIGSRVVVFHKR